MLTWHALFFPFSSVSSSHERPGAFRMQEDVVVHTVFYLALDTTVRYGLGGVAHYTLEGTLTST